MSPVLPTAGQRPYDLNSWLLVGHDVNGNNLAAAPDATKVDKDSVVVAATRILASKLLAGDAQAAFQIQGDGTHRWGPGGATAFDAHLYRSAASVLTVQASVIVTGNHNTSYSVGVDQANGGGGLYFGSASDVILLRTGASQLQLSGNLKATGNVFGTQYVAAFGAFADAQAQMMFHANYAGAGQPAVRWGPGGAAALDCDLYRAGPASLVTGGGLIVGGNLSGNGLITGNYSTAFQAASNASGSVALNAASLPNDGYLFSMKQLADASWRLLVTSAGQMIFGDGAGNPTANLYWKSASVLGTDSNFYAGGEMRANNGGVSTQIYLGGDGKIYFGTAGDTNLYRSGAGKLRTDGTLDANALTINGVPIGSVPTGAMFDWPIAAAPTGFLLCDGSAVSRTTYAALFTLLGSTYGGGDGSTTFNLPDFRGRVAVGLGTNADVNAVAKNDGVAVAGRTPRHSHTSALTLPNHGHSITDPQHSHTQMGNGNAGAGSDVVVQAIISAANPVNATASSPTGITVGNPTANPAIAGTVGLGGGAVDAPAYLVTNKIIKT